MTDDGGRLDILQNEAAINHLLNVKQVETSSDKTGNTSPRPNTLLLACIEPVCSLRHKPVSPMRLAVVLQRCHGSARLCGETAAHSLGHDAPHVAGIQGRVPLLFLGRAVHGKELSTEKLRYLWEGHTTPVSPVPPDTVTVSLTKDQSEHCPSEPPTHARMPTLCTYIVTCMHSHVHLKTHCSAEHPRPPRQFLAPQSIHPSSHTGAESLGAKRLHVHFHFPRYQVLCWGYKATLPHLKQRGIDFTWKLK